MPGFADLKNIASMGASGWATDAKNRTENAQKLLKNHATTRNRENNISYMLKGGFETEIYYDYDAGAWKMVVVTGQLNVGGGFGMSWNFNSFCGPVPVTAQLAFGVALDVQFAAAVDRTQMANDYLTQVQLNAFIRAFGGIGFDYAILAMKVGLFGQLSFQGAVRFLNAIGEAQAKVGYKIDFLGEVGIEFLIKFLFITYERVLWSQKIQIPSIQDNNWDAIEKYWEEVQQGNSGNEYEIITPGETQQASLAASQQPELLAADSSTGVALYGAPSTATLESRDYLESPRTYGGSLQVLRARAQTLAENTTSTGYQELIGNSYSNSEPFLTEDGAILAFLHDHDSTQLEDTKASYVQWNGASFGEEDIHAFPDPAGTDEGEGEGADAQANQESIQGGDNQLRLAGTNSAAIAAWTRVTETLAKEPGSAVAEDEQLLMMNSSEILASVWDGTQWVTTRLTQNSSADMAPVVAVGGGKALVAWRAVAASDSGAPTEFDSYDTIQYKVYDFNTEKWSGLYTLYNGTSGAVKGMEAQMTESGAMAVAYTIEKGSTSSTTRAVTLEDGTTEITSNLQTVFALIQPDATEASTGLTEIVLSQIPLRMEDGVEAEGTTTFQVTAGASLTETTLTVLQEYLSATVTVNGNPYDVNDTASRTFSLPVGTTTLDIVVTSGDKTHTYRVEITRPSTGGGTGGSTRYPITVPEEDHGTVSVSPSRASSGQTVTITVTPDEGYKVGSVTVKRPNGSTVPVTGQGNGKYTFTMPSGGITVDVTFIPEDWPFVDVTEDKWYYDAVAYVYQQGIMVGMSETTFEPNTTVNRAQVVQMLYNLEGQPQVSGDSGFSDIRDGQWYAKAVAWASANDVVAGYEDGTFRPTRAVTREEFAQILYNYAKFKGYGLSASADLGQFPDAGQVSSWAETALGWANGNGLINGHDDGRLDPKGSTIRAQAASILMNFDKGFAQEG